MAYTAQAATNEYGQFYGLSYPGAFNKTTATTLGAVDSGEKKSIWDLKVDSSHQIKLEKLINKNVRFSLLAARVYADGTPANAMVFYNKNQKNIRGFGAHVCEIIIPGVGAYRELAKSISFKKEKK